MVLFCRTSEGGRKNGMSQLLVDLTLPGIKISTIEFTTAFVSKLPDNQLKRPVSQPLRASSWSATPDQFA